VNAALSLDLGPGGDETAPRPPFQFVKGKLSGTNAKVEVGDAGGRLWNVKFGGSSLSRPAFTTFVCGSEFGRTPVVGMGSGFMGGQTHNGRNHNPHGFTMWLAGGGVKGGMTYGATDDFGWKAVDKPVHVHDIHATILYLLEIDHAKLTYRHSGRDFRLTDVAGNVIHDIIA
jgi:Protein of unknown function (DUF1501)